jgi:hypothetical protein
MGNCKPNCCFEKKSTFVLEVEQEVLKKSRDESVACLGRGKTMIMRTASIFGDDLNLTTAV